MNIPKQVNDAKNTANTALGVMNIVFKTLFPNPGPGNINNKPEEQFKNESEEYASRINTDLVNPYLTNSKSEKLVDLIVGSLYSYIHVAEDPDNDNYKKEIIELIMSKLKTDITNTIQTKSVLFKQRVLHIVLTRLVEQIDNIKAEHLDNYQPIFKKICSFFIGENNQSEINTKGDELRSPSPPTSFKGGSPDKFGYPLAHVNNNTREIKYGVIEQRIHIGEIENEKEYPGFRMAVENIYDNLEIKPDIEALVEYLCSVLYLDKISHYGVNECLCMLYAYTTSKDDEWLDMYKLSLPQITVSTPIHSNDMSSMFQSIMNTEEYKKIQNTFDNKPLKRVEEFKHSLDTIETLGNLTNVNSNELLETSLNMEQGLPSLENIGQSAKLAETAATDLTNKISGSISNITNKASRLANTAAASFGDVANKATTSFGNLEKSAKSISLPNISNISKLTDATKSKSVANLKNMATNSVSRLMGIGTEKDLYTPPDKPDIKVIIEAVLTNFFNKLDDFFSTHSDQIKQKTTNMIINRIHRLSEINTPNEKQKIVNEYLNITELATKSFLNLFTEEQLNALFLGELSSVMPSVIQSIDTFLQGKYKTDDGTVAMEIKNENNFITTVFATITKHSQPSEIHELFNTAFLDKLNLEHKIKINNVLSENADLNNEATKYENICSISNINNKEITFLPKDEVLDNSVNEYLAILLEHLYFAKNEKDYNGLNSTIWNKIKKILNECFSDDSFTGETKECFTVLAKQFIHNLMGEKCISLPAQQNGGNTRPEETTEGTKTETIKEKTETTKKEEPNTEGTTDETTKEQTTDGTTTEGSTTEEPTEQPPKKEEPNTKETTTDGTTTDETTEETKEPPKKEEPTTDGTTTDGTTTDGTTTDGTTTDGTTTDGTTTDGTTTDTTEHQPEETPNNQATEQTNTETTSNQIIPTNLMYYLYDDDRQNDHRNILMVNINYIHEAKKKDGNLPKLSSMEMSQIICYTLFYQLFNHFVLDGLPEKSTLLNLIPIGQISNNSLFTYDIFVNDILKKNIQTPKEDDVYKKYYEIFIKPNENENENPAMFGGRRNKKHTTKKYWKRYPFHKHTRRNIV